MTNSTTERIRSLKILSQWVDDKKMTEEWSIIKHQTITQNPWFTDESIEKSMQSIQKELFNENRLLTFVSKYTIPESPVRKRIGLVMAGNIPMVGIHDIIMVYLSGHKAVIKYSEKDMVLIPWLINILNEINVKNNEYFEKADRLNDIDAVIATGSDNSARYFEAYFGKYPNIIRKNRNSVAILSKDTTDDKMREVMRDIFDYFGLGCRNVSKIYLEKGFDIQKFLDISEEFNEVNHHNKYRNNYDYNLSLYLLNKKKFLQSGSIILLEDKKLTSRIATLHYEWFENIEEVVQTLKENFNSIQCIVSNIELPNIKTIKPGQTQCPAIDDFADNIDTLSFLLNL